MMVEIVWDRQKLRHIAWVLGKFPAAMRRVVPRAVNQVADQVREDVTDEITAIRNIRRSSVRNKITMKKARANFWLARLGISKRRISLMGFGAKWFYAPGTARGSRGIGGRGTNYRISTMKIARQRVVTYNISGQRYLQHAFIARGKQGNMLVFQRKNLAYTDPLHKDLRSLSGPSLGQVVTDAPAILERVGSAGAERLSGVIEAHIRQFLAELSGGLVSAKGLRIKSPAGPGRRAAG